MSLWWHFVRAAVLLAIAGFAGPLASQPAPRQLQGTVIDFPNYNPVELGWGWDDRRAGAVRQTCIDFREAKQDFLDKRLSLQIANDHEALSRVLNVSVSGKMSAMGGGKFSASASFAHSASLVSTGEHIAILAEVMTAPKFVAPPTGPSPTVAALGRSPDGSSVDMRSFYQGASVRLKENLRVLAAQNPAEFVKQCGTSFIAVVHSGARINALLTFREIEEKDRKEIKASAKGSGGGYSMNASLNNLVEKYSKTGKLEIKFEQLGGSDRAFPMNKDALLEAVSGLPSEAALHPRPFLMIVQNYETLPDWPKATVLPELTDEEILTRAYFRLISLMGFADEALNAPGNFLLKFDTTREDVVKLYDQMLEERNALRTLVLGCKDGACSAEKWRTWTDMKHRARMPMPGGFESLAYKPGSAGIDRLPALVADRRVGHWIVEANQWRCQYESECMRQEEVENLRQQIRARVSNSINAR